MGERVGCEVKLILPWPPSPNHYYRSMVMRGPKPRAMTYISEEGKAFQNNVKASIWKSLKAVPTKIMGRLSVTVTLYQPNARSIDIDNRLKPLLDSLTKSGVWEDDSQIDCLQISRGPISRTNPRCEVTIEVIKPAEKELFPE